MIRSDGRCRLDTVEVGEASINMFGPAPSLIAKYRVFCSESSDSVGPGNRNAWSEQTLTKLQELIGSMEADIAASIFEGGTTGGSEGAVVATTTDGVPGL